jgi:sulfonate transport system permease protein
MSRISVTRIAKALIVPIALTIIWDLLVRSGALPPSQAASPVEVLTTLAKLIRSGTILAHTLYSLSRLIAGVTIGALLAVAFALTVSLSLRAAALLTPMTQLLAGVPVVLWMPFCVMVFGTGETYKISLVSVGTFFLVQVFVLQSIREVHRQYIELADIYEKDRRVRVLHLFIPASLPAIFTAVRAAFAAGWIVLFFVEFATSFAGREGLGWFIADARHSGRIEQEFAGLAWLGVLALFVDLLISRLQITRLRWVDVATQRSVWPA